MKSIEITPSLLKGNISVPASKSLGHRAVICAALAEGESHIFNCPGSMDLSATISAMKTLGAKIEKDGSNLIVDGTNIFNNENNLAIDCFESGSTLRFLIPVASFAKGKVTFNGRGRLAERPLAPYLEIFDEMGVEYGISGEGLPFTVIGRLKSGIYRLRGDVSSQFVSGLMLALPLMQGGSEIHLTTELESRSYVDLTTDVMAKFGVYVENVSGRYEEFHIKGGQKYHRADYIVEGDFSQAAFWLAAGALNGGVCCSGMDPDSLQGDKQIVEIIRLLGYRVEWSLPYSIGEDRGPDAGAFPENRMTEIDCAQIPDIVPIIATLAALTEGVTILRNAARLRLKESDRLSAITSGLSALGADIEETEDSLIVKGVKRLHGGVADACGDHRIAMSLAIAASGSEGTVTIKGHECVEKSYPDFWFDYMNLGGIINECDVG